MQQFGACLQDQKFRDCIVSVQNCKSGNAYLAVKVKCEEDRDDGDDGVVVNL
jgi:hypothetical protein